MDVMAKRKQRSVTEANLVNLVGECVRFVEQYCPSSPAQAKWKQDWLGKVQILALWESSPSLETELATLIDGAYSVVELSYPHTPIDIERQGLWLEEARRLVPGCSSLDSV